MRGTKAETLVRACGERGRNPDIRTYRGSDIDELLPQIRAELGADAIVIRQREGLDGGFGGFFQKRCVEVVARRATPGLDAYDASDAQSVTDARDVAPEPPAPAIAEIMRVASPFIEQLRAAEVAVAAPQAVELAVEEQRVTSAFGTTAYAMTAGGAMVAVAPVVDPAPAAPAPPLQLVRDDERRVATSRPRAAKLATRTPTPSPTPSPRPAPARPPRTSTRSSPRASPRSLPPTSSARRSPTSCRSSPGARSSARCARRLPAASRSAPPVCAGGRAIAFVGAGGSGKTLCADRLAAAYREHSDLDVSAVGPGEARRDAGDATLTVIDTAAVSPGSPADVKRLAAELRRLGRPEVHVAVPATLSGNAVRALLDGFAALKPAAIVLTHLDEVGHAGPVIDEAIARGIAISYTSDGSAPDGFAPADPAALAARILA